MMIQIEHYGDGPTRGVFKQIDVARVESPSAIARKVYFEFF
jgi:hypothetical protein